MEESVQTEALLVSSRSVCCLFLEIGLCFQNFTLASVSTNAAQVDLTQNPEGRELLVATLVAATCARQKD